MKKRQSKEIIMIAPTPFFSDRGCHVRVLNSYLSYRRAGKDILLITYPLGRDIEGVETRRIPSIPGYRKTAPGFSVFKPVLDVFLLCEALRQYKKHRPTLLYCHLHEGAIAGLLIKGLFPSVTVIFDAQGSLSGELVSNGTIKSNYIIRLMDRIEFFIIRRSDRIITSTYNLRDRFNGLLCSDKAEAVVDIPDETLFNPDVKPANDIELPRDKKIAAYLGGMKKNKGIRYLIEAIPFTSADIHFLLMGYPLEEVRSMVKSLGIEKRVTLLGPIPYELSGRYLKCADVAVSPKVLSESGEANAKLYIYDALGLPVVCFDNEENRRILNGRGYFAAERDVQDLAKKIEEACREANQ